MTIHEMIQQQADDYCRRLDEEDKLLKRTLLANQAWAEQQLIAWQAQEENRRVRRNKLVGWVFVVCVFVAVAAVMWGNW